MAAIAGLEAFGLTKNGLARLGRRTCMVEISLRTYEVTPAVRRRVPAERHGYLARRVDRWIQSLRHTYPNLHFRVTQGAPEASSAPAWSSFPSKLTVSVPARDVLKLAAAAGVGHVWLSKIQGCRRREPLWKSRLPNDAPVLHPNGEQTSARQRDVKHIAHLPTDEKCFADRQSPNEFSVSAANTQKLLPLGIGNDNVRTVCVAGK